MPKLVNKTEENERMVTQLSGLGLPHEQICSILNISKPSLYKYYQGTGTGREAVTACIFWLKTQARWTEKQVLEIQDGTEQDDKFRQLIKDIQRAKLAETDSDNTTH